MLLQKCKEEWKTLLILLGIFIFALWKNMLGFQCDEAYTIALGDMIARGDAMFKEIWSSLQMSGIFAVPFFLIYARIVGGYRRNFTLFSDYFGMYSGGYQHLLLSDFCKGIF